MLVSIDFSPRKCQTHLAENPSASEAGFSPSLWPLQPLRPPSERMAEIPVLLLPRQKHEVPLPGREPAVVGAQSL